MVKHFFEQDWEIVPAGGATGEAFFATNEREKLFLKRNSSPFLAVLSAEGIVPKLVWTKRMENGDVITAQECLNGRECKPQDMTHYRVAKLLKKIHESRPLLTMLSRLGKTVYKPEMMLSDIAAVMDGELMAESTIQTSLRFLQSNLSSVQCETWTVCHGDIHHNNWLLSEDGRLYLIDWDGAAIADPAFDLGPLLYFYIPRADWENWLNQYGINMTNHLLLRMKWYTIAHTILSIGWHKNKNRLREMDACIGFLGQLM
jgi:thiamine kinase-like enzyme